MDGGSQDGTDRYLASIEFPGLQVVSEPDNGIYDAMRKGLARARGKYVVFLNSGDTFVTERTLAEVARELTRTGPDFLYGDAIESDGAKTFYKAAKSMPYNRIAMLTHHQAQYYLTSIAREVGFDESYELSADWALTSRVLGRPATKAVYLNSPLCVFQRGGVSQQGGRHRAVLNRELFRIYREEHHWPVWTASALWVRKVLINKIRATFPLLYDIIRYRTHRPEEAPDVCRRPS